jgi:hypothetical protein
MQAGNRAEDGVVYAGLRAFRLDQPDVDFREIHVLGVFVEFRTSRAPRHVFHLGDFRKHALDTTGNPVGFLHTHARRCHGSNGE